MSTSYRPGKTTGGVLAAAMSTNTMKSPDRFNASTPLLCLWSSVWRASLLAHRNRIGHLLLQGFGYPLLLCRPGLTSPCNGQIPLRVVNCTPLISVPHSTFRVYLLFPFDIPAWSLFKTSGTPYIYYPRPERL
jgi:hypothetical protein